MKALVCEMCGSQDLVKQDGMFVCQNCGTKYSVEEAKKMMIEGTVQIDNSAFVEKYLQNARRAKQKEDWEEVEKYYNLVEQNAPENMEAVFYSAYGKLRCTLLTFSPEKWNNDFKVLKKSFSLLDEYFDMDKESEQRQILTGAVQDVIKLTNVVENHITISSDVLPYQVASRTRDLYPQMIETLENIILKYKERDLDYTYLSDMKDKLSQAEQSGGCYVATAIYGSYDCPQVWTLRRYRDYTLAETWYGRSFIALYYAISPSLVKWFGEMEWFKKMWKPKLDRLVIRLNRGGVDSSPYQDRQW